MPFARLASATTPTCHLGLGLAAVGRPGYINLGRDHDLGGDRGVDALRTRTHELLDAAYAQGVRYVDAARSYGRSEEFLAEWLKNRPGADDVVVGSKWGYTYTADWSTDAERHEVKDHSLAAYERQRAESEALLGDRLDLYQIHSVTPDSPALTDRDLHARLADAAAQGLTVGFSTSGPAQADAVRAKLLPESRTPNPGPWDLAGVVLSLVGMVGVVYAVKEAATHGFGPLVPAAGLLGAGALYGFVRRQLTLPAPLLDMRLFRHRGFSGAVLADLLTILGLSGLVFFLSQYLQLVQGRRPLEAGLAELPAAIGAVAAGLVAGRAARRFSVRSVVAGGLAAVGLALAALTVIGQSTGYPLLGAALLVVGLGAGFSFTVTADVILSSVPGEQAGAASAVSETAYELGAALGIAVLGSVVTGVYRDFAGPAGTPAAAHESLGGAVEAASHLPAHTAEAMLDAARQSFVDGLALAAGVGAAVLLAASVAAWFLLRGQRLEGAAEHP
ncbi:Putative multidrug resistance protein MdtD [Streptomyces griseomycini]